MKAAALDACEEWLDLETGIIYEMPEEDLPRELEMYEPVPERPSWAWLARQQFVRVRSSLEYGHLGCVEAMRAAMTDWRALPASERTRIERMYRP